MSLARAPERQASGPLALLGRFIFIVIFLAVVGGIGWAVLVNGSIDSTETLDRDVVAPGTIVIIPGLTEIHLRSEGSGEPVLFIHDFDMAGGYQWTKTAELLADHRLLMPDLVDFGFSARPSFRGRLHTVVGQAETMLGLLEELGISNLSVVGAGLGGSIAAQMASLEPGVVDRLVLIAPEILGPEPTWQSMLYRLPSVGDAMTFTFMGAGARADASYSAGCGNGGYCPDAETRAARQAAAMVPGTTDALTAMFATPPASTLPDSLGTITVPTLIIWGDDDTVTPLTQGQDLQRALVGSSLEIVAGAGHRPHLEDPEATAALISAFLSS
ncbi:MAG TPA: alpha/beta hydrolase [Acidimicrobiia bacterium]|nr:alpha/beta hydrolase [Acidimicrobiia bacterium]